MIIPDMEFKELLFRSGIGRTDCASLLRVTEHTVQNWIRYGGPDWACERLSLPLSKTDF